MLWLNLSFWILPEVSVEDLDFLLPDPSSLCSPHGRPMDLRDEVLRQGIQLYLESLQTEIAD